MAAKVKTVWGVPPQDEALSARMAGETVAQVGPARMSIVGNVALEGQQARAEHANADYHYSRASINILSIANLDISPKPCPLAKYSDGLIESSPIFDKYHFLLVPGALMPGLEKKNNTKSEILRSISAYGKHSCT